MDRYLDETSRKDEKEQRDLKENDKQLRRKGAI